ncbi:hypothetical protein BsIDN1_41520 [Bacillus safensis]|uniref:Uncharacterized protein n=1 Tax=Bacillus safensis TaxID=561879 RepID=A0A5S9MEJ2_BACIA|nr:hypothetical protein BsIDN1_41520 [Bacillus safensis]
MELLFLGTGAGIPAKTRNVTCTALKLLEERNAVWLFDCGEATQHQILHTTIKPRKIEKIFITHMHGDHVYGLPGLLGSRSFQGGEDELTIYGPKGIKAFVNAALSATQTHLTYPLHIIEIDEGVVFEDDTFQVEARRESLTGFQLTAIGLWKRYMPGSLKSRRPKKKSV